MAVHDGETLEALCAGAREAFGTGDEARALALMERACERFGDKPRAWREAAGLRFALGDVDGALVCLDHAAEVSSRPADELYEKGVMLARVGRRDEALACYREVVRIDPRQADAWINMGAILDDRGEALAAIGCYDHAIVTAPDDAMAWANRGNSFAQLGRFDDALASYDHAIALGDGQAVGARRKALVHAGRVAEANRARAHGTFGDQGQACELRHDGLVARWFTGRHSNPELLEDAVRQFLELTARCRDTPKGIREGTTLQLGWAVFTLLRERDALVLCEPDWQRDARRCVVREVTVSAQQQVLASMIHQLLRAPPEDCSCHDTLLVEHGALASERVYMRRVGPAQHGDSGWVLTRAPEGAADVAPLPMSALATSRPHLLKVVTLPVGYRVQLDAHAVTAAWDASGVQCFAP